MEEHWRIRQSHNTKYIYEENNIISSKNTGRQPEGDLEVTLTERSGETGASEEYKVELERRAEAENFKR